MMYLYGASGHAKVIIEVLQSKNTAILGLFDDNKDIRSILGYTVYHDASIFETPIPLIISIGNNRIRAAIANRIQALYQIAIHQQSHVSPSASLGEGTVVMNAAQINASANIGRHVIVNTSAIVEHDCQVGDYCHISPNATLCGGVAIGTGTQVGANATIIPNINIGKWVIIGAGAVIIEDVPDYAVIVGNPGKIIKYTNANNK